MNLRMILEMMAMTILGGAGIVFPVGLSLLFFFNGEFDGSQTLALYAILVWLMIPEKQGDYLTALTDRVMIGAIKFWKRHFSILNGILFLILRGIDNPIFYLAPKVVQLSVCSCRETRSSKIGVFSR